MTDIAAAYDAMRSRQAFLAAPPHLERDEQQRLLDLIRPDHIGVFTSGSTSTPRCITRSWDSWRVSFPAVNSRMQVHPGETVALIGAPHSTMVLFAAMHALHHAATPTVVDPRTLVTLEDRASDAAVVHAVPPAVDAFLDQVIAGERHAPRLIVTAGASAPRDVWVKAERAGVPMVEYYGAAETSFIAWRTAPGQPFDAVPGCAIDVRDGVIWVRSPYTAVGYLDDRAGPMRRDGDWVSVGDHGELTDAGTLLLRGRGDTAVTTAGHTIHVEDVETAIRAIAGVDDVAVIGIPHHDLGQIVAAVHVGSATETTLRTATRALPGPARPRMWVHRAELPRLPGGKVDRAALQRELTDLRGRR